MIEIPNVTLYACSHCGRKFQRKHFAVYHEQYVCKKNPNNDHICFEGHGCKYLEREECIIEDEYGPAITIGTKFYCTKNNDDKEMYTFRQSPRRRFFNENISPSALRMPVDCKDYVENDIPF